MFIKFDSKQIKELKTAKGETSYRTLSKDLKISVTSINNLFQGKNVSYKTASKVCKKLGYDLKVSISIQKNLFAKK